MSHVVLRISMNQTLRRKEKVRETGRIYFYVVVSSKDSSYYVCTQPILSGLPLQYTTHIAVHKGRMWQESTYPVELKSSLKRALEKAEQGCRVSSACPKNTLTAEVEFFWMTALLSIIPNQKGAAAWVCCKKPGEGHTGSAPCLCCRLLYHGHSIKQERNEFLPVWIVFPAHLLHEHLLIFQVLAPDYLI